MKEREREKCSSTLDKFPINNFQLFTIFSLFIQFFFLPFPFGHFFIHDYGVGNSNYSVLLNFNDANQEMWFSWVKLQKYITLHVRIFNQKDSIEGKTHFHKEIFHLQSGYFKFPICLNNFCIIKKEEKHGKAKKEIKKFCLGITKLFK